MIPTFHTVEKLKDILSTFRWPIQSQPTLSAQKLWMKTFKEIFQINENKLPLTLRSKEWITNTEERQMTHQWYYIPT